MNYINQSRQMANIRIFHAATIAEPVDIYFNDRLMVKGLKFSEATNYLPVNRGMYNIKIYSTNNNKLLYNQTISIDNNKFITLSAINGANKLQLIVVEDETSGIIPKVMDEEIPIVPSVPSDINGVNPAGEIDADIDESENLDTGFNPNQFNRVISDNSNLFRNGTMSKMAPVARVRFIHLSPNAPGVDVVLLNGIKLFNDTKYKEATDYINVTPGIYTLQVRPTGSDMVLLTIPNINLETNQVYTIYAIGLVNGNPPLEAVILVDGK